MPNKSESTNWIRNFDELLLFFVAKRKRRVKAKPQEMGKTDEKSKF
jgi:hypothetical protein